jgi:hypothetical protein
MSGGAGFYPAGGTPGGPASLAGVDPAYVPSLIVPLQTLVAIEFDPSTRQFVMNADGSFVGIHPVDQMVCLLLWLQQGDVPSAATLGNRIKVRISRVDPTTIPQIATDEVNTVLRALLDAGDIELASPPGGGSAVVVDTGVRGAAKIAVYYRNLRLPGSQVRKTTGS